MTLKIEKQANGQQMIIRLSGRLQSQYLDELEAQLEGDWQGIALDLEAVTLVDVDAVRFLNACEESGIKLLDCWPYIREWMVREKDRG